MQHVCTCRLLHSAVPAEDRLEEGAVYHPADDTVAASSRQARCREGHQLSAPRGEKELALALVIDQEDFLFPFQKLGSALLKSPFVLRSLVLKRYEITGLRQVGFQEQAVVFVYEILLACLVERRLAGVWTAPGNCVARSQRDQAAVTGPTHADKKLPADDLAPDVH